MEIGFTGTRKGMTQAQKATLMALLLVERPSVLHHGSEEHSDTEAAQIATVLKIETRPHPPLKKTADELLARNRRIVECSDMLLAAPKSFDEEVRSGTWYTVRQARKKGIRRLIIWPDGRMEEEP